MATRIRLAAVAVALTLLMIACLAGVTWAANIKCPNDPKGNTGTCWGTAVLTSVSGQTDLL